MDIGKRVLEGYTEVKETTAPQVPANTSELLEQAKELAQQEAKLKSNFPAATKVLDPEFEAPSGNSSSIVSVAENGHESESSGVLVEKEECVTPPVEADDCVSRPVLNAENS